MKSPKLLFLRWVDWLGTLVRFGPSEDSGTIREASRELDASELVARFIHSKSQLSKSHGKPKRTAFDPSPHNELSVVHSTGLPDRDLWQIGRQTLVDQPGRDKIHGRADIP